MNEHDSISVHLLRPGDVIVCLGGALHRPHLSELVRLVVGVERTCDGTKITYVTMSPRAREFFGVVSSIEVHDSRCVIVTLAWKKT